MALDDVFLLIGEFGKYQYRNCILFCIPIIFSAMHKICGSFLNFKPEYQCYNAEIILSNNTCDNCDEFIYNTDIVSVSTTTEWNLICDKDWMRSTSDTIFMSGSFLGSLVLGSLSDKYGRRPIFLLSQSLQFVGGVFVAFSPNYLTFVISRFIVGISVGGLFSILYVMSAEIVGPSKRRITGNLCQLFWSIGYVLVGVLAYFFRNWRNLQLAMTLPSILLIFYWWFLPESARWLIAKGKIEKAKDILESAAKENKKIITRFTLDELLAKNKFEIVDESSILTLIIKYPNLRKKTFILCFNSALISCIYYSLSWGATNLNGNHFINHIVSGLVEVPVYIILIFTVDLFCRKKILCGSMILTGISLIATGIFVNYSNVLIGFYMIGKMGITAAFSTIYLFAAEQFPTVIRNAGIGAVVMSVSIGGIIATHAEQLGSISNRLPFFAMAFGAFIVSILFIFLSDTRNKSLPETMKDNEK